MCKEIRAVSDMITNSHVPDTLIFEAGKLNIQVNDGVVQKEIQKVKILRGVSISTFGFMALQNTTTY